MSCTDSLSFHKNARKLPVCIPISKLINIKKTLDFVKAKPKK